MKLNFKEKYLIILVVLCFISVCFYYSYAIFVTKQLQENVVVVKVDNDLVNLKVNDGNNSINIKANSSQDVKITLENHQSIDYYYLVLVKGLIEGVKVSSSGEIRSEIKSDTKKELLVHINNTTIVDVQLEFVVKVSHENNLDKDVGYNFINDIDNYDHSKANKPEFTNLNLIPVSYKKTSDKEGYWYIADKSNQTDLWYSYENGLWANAVLLNNSNYNKYKNKSVGTEIELGDVLGFYVWIPRFKYYLINSSNYTNYERINHVVFENGNNSTGTVECLDKISNINDSHIFSEICKDIVYNHLYDNLSTYTHPAFKEKNGFWVSKFLMGEGEKVIPNTSILKRNISDANVISNKYNAHVLTNMEYGAVVILSNSLYGKTGNGMYSNQDDITFTRVYANTYEYEVTGCSGEYNIHTKNIITDVNKKCTPYNDLTNYSHVSNSISYPIGYAGAGASTTGTINGVYDLANLTGELVAAYVTDLNGVINTTSNNYDLYSNNTFIGKVGSSSNIYNLYRYKLGDSIRESFRNFGENGMWNSGTLIQNKNTGILVRGSNASIYSASIEDITHVAPFRIVLN